MSRFLSKRGPVISAWAAVSPFGIGREAFRDGLLAGHGTAAPVSGPEDRAAGPGEMACVVPGFEIREVLGKKGTRSMDRLTAVAVATVGQLVAHADAEAESGPGRALVLGTTTGSAQSMMDFTRSSLTGDKPFFVDPARFPNTVMNCAAGQAAIWHQLKGPNVTIGGGRAAGLLALNYARRLQRTARARSVLCGGAEEYSPARAWLQRHSRADDEAGAVLGEGCAMLLVEPAGPDCAERPGLAEVLAIEFGVFAGPGDVRTVLSSVLRRAFASAGADPAQLWAVAPGGVPGGLGVQEHAAIQDVLGDAAPRSIPCTALIGDTAAAAATFQLVSALAFAENEPSARARLALVTAVDRDGVVGCALLRIPGGAGAGAGAGKG